jgi:hypothetical protein
MLILYKQFAGEGTKSAHKIGHVNCLGKTLGILGEKVAGSAEKSYLMIRI